MFTTKTELAYTVRNIGHQVLESCNFSRQAVSMGEQPGSLWPQLEQAQSPRACHAAWWNGVGENSHHEFSQVPLVIILNRP